MFDSFKKNEMTYLDKPISRVLNEMEEYGPEAEEYPEFLSYLERLTHLKTEDRRKKVSPDTIANVAGNLFGILIIVAYEQKHVMVSKALTFLPKVTKSM